MTTTTLRVRANNKQTDWSVLSDQPINTWIDDVADRHGLKDDTTWSIRVPGSPPVPRDQSLDEARITDGTQVILTPVTKTERYRMLVEDVIDVPAILNDDPRFGRNDLITWLAYTTAIMLVGVAASGVFAWTVHHSVWWGPTLAVVGILCAVTATKLGSHSRLVFAAGVGAVTNLATGAGLAVPLPSGAHWLGAPQLAAAAATVVACLLLMRGGASRWRAWTGFLAASSTITTLASVGIGYGGARWVWPLVTYTGLLLVKNAARWVMRVARIALPPIPPPGQDISMDELEPAAVSDGNTWQDRILASVPSSAARLVERSALTQHLLAGFTAAGSAAAALGTVVVFQSGHFLPHTTVLTVLVIITLVFRARLPADRRAVWALLSGAAAIVIGVVGKLLVWWPHWAPLTLGITLAGLVVVVAAVLATEDTRLDQVQQHWLEHLDTATIAAIPILLAWIGGLFDVLRNLPWING